MEIEKVVKDADEYYKKNGTLFHMHSNPRIQFRTAWVAAAEHYCNELPCNKDKAAEIQSIIDLIRKIVAIPSSEWYISTTGVIKREAAEALKKLANITTGLKDYDSSCSAGGNCNEGVCHGKECSSYEPI